jgi:hypothetical protein
MTRIALVLVVACAAPKVSSVENRTGDLPTLQIGPVKPGTFYNATINGKTVTVIEASIDGEVEEPPQPSTDEIHRIVTMHQGRLRDCFISHGATGTTTVTLTIEADGTASSSAWSDWRLPKVDHCIIARGWPRLPKPTGSWGPRQRQYTFDVTLIERLRQR